MDFGIEMTGSERTLHDALVLLLQSKQLPWCPNEPAEGERTVWMASLGDWCELRLKGDHFSLARWAPGEEGSFTINLSAGGPVGQSGELVRLAYEQLRRMAGLLPFRDDAHLYAAGVVTEALSAERLPDIGGAA